MPLLYKILLGLVVGGVAYRAIRGSSSVNTEGLAPLPGPFLPGSSIIIPQGAREARVPMPSTKEP